MNNNKIYTKLIEIIEDVSCQKVINKENRLYNDLNIDSLLFLDIISNIEGVFNIEFVAEDFNKLTTVDDLLCTITNKME